MNYNKNTLRTFFSLIMLIILVPLGSNAQVNLLNGKAAEKEREKRFIMHVKQIEEFIERFNDDTSTLLLQYFDTVSNIKHSRKELLLHLFDFTDRKIDKEKIVSFQEQITNVRNPEFLDYNGNDWFAVYKCIFDVNGKDKEVKLTLKHNCFDDGSCKWTIITIDPNFISFPPKNENVLFINSKSHGTDFLCLRQIFKNSHDIYRYLNTPDDIRPMDLFSLLLYDSLITYKRSGSLEYYFLQIKNWIIKVEYFNRSNYNSGWLISGLIEADLNDKIKFKKDFLNISQSNE